MVVPIPKGRFGEGGTGVRMVVEIAKHVNPGA